MSSKKQIGQFIERVKEKATSENKFALPQPPRLKKYYDWYLSDKNNLFAEGAYRGTLFEYYVTPLLILAAHELSFVKWFVPSLTPAKHLKPRQRKNRISYNHQGQIIIQDGSFPTAEFDGIIRIGKKIVIIEIKYYLPKDKKSIQKILSRLDFFNSAYKKEPHLLLIVAEESTPFSEEDSFTSHERVHVLNIPNYKEYRSKFESGKITVTKKKLEKFKSKLRLPHEVLPHKINFSKHRRQLMKAFNEYFKQEITGQEFFEENQQSINLVGRIPLGKVSPSCDLRSSDSPMKLFSDLLSSKVPCVFCIKFREPNVYPEIISCKKEYKGRIPHYRRSTYDYETGQFPYGKLNVTKRTVTYRLANQIIKKSKTRNLELKEINALIEAAQQLTEYWTENSDLALSN